MGTVALHHEITGPADAPVLMLAGSLGSSMAMWDPQWVALAGRFRLVRLDHRGHGGSPEGAGPAAMADLAGDVLALLDRLDLDRVAYCGLSLGGMVGMWLGAHAPERLSSLVLCCTSVHFTDPAPWTDRAAAVRSAGTGSIAPAVVSRWFTPGWAGEHQEAVDAAVAMVGGTPDESYATACEAIAAWDGRELLGRITAPTLVIAGDADPATPVSPHAETIAGGIPGSQLQVLAGAHLVTIEQAQQATALIAAHAAGS